MKAAPDWTLLADLARDQRRDDLAIRSEEGVGVGCRPEPPRLSGFAASIEGRPDPALVKAVVRQESAFDPKAISHAGARGLMQLMQKRPTGSPSGSTLGTHDRGSRGPKYNVTIGRAYLSQLLEDYGALRSWRLRLQCRSRAVKRWLKHFGDPNRSVEHAVDWIGSIPFYETRNYVQRVLENFTVYRGRGTNRDPTLSPQAVRQRGSFHKTTLAKQKKRKCPKANRRHQSLRVRRLRNTIRPSFRRRSISRQPG